MKKHYIKNVLIATVFTGLAAVSVSYGLHSGQPQLAYEFENISHV